MRIGLAVVFAVIFLVLTWIGLGYLLADNINAHETLDHMQQQSDQTLKDKNDIQDQLNKTNYELGFLRQQMVQMDQHRQMLQNQVKQLLEENQNLRSQNAELERQLAQGKNAGSLALGKMDLLSQPILLALFLPISILTSLAIYKSHRSADFGQGSEIEQTMSIRVTEEERKQLIKMRRSLLRKS